MMLSKEVRSIVDAASADKRKGNYHVYEFYKQKLQMTCTSTAEYQEACRDVAKALRV